jgi:GNAT superfamily N-acetyltransferase
MTMPLPERRLSRLRPVHRKMSWEAFERLPHRLGWKHEYYGGMAHLRPSCTSVVFELDLALRVVRQRRGIRAIASADAAVLRQPFLEAFAVAPEYVGWPLAKFRRAAGEYLERYFGTVRGEPSSVSVLAEVAGEVVGAALVKDRPQGPLLDCIFVRPDHARKGWATTLMAHAVNGLVERSAGKLRSNALLANTASVAWHTRFGFRELPSLWVAQARARHYGYELDRLQQLGLSESEWREIENLAKYWEVESQRLWEIEQEDFRAVHPMPD